MQLVPGASRSLESPLYPRKRTCAVQLGMSALCQEETHALQQTAAQFDHFFGNSDQHILNARREIKRKTIAERRVGYLPASSGVIRRTVTRRFCSLGPCTGTLSCCSP